MPADGPEPEASPVGAMLVVLSALKTRAIFLPPWAGLMLPALVMPLMPIGKNIWVAWLLALGTLLACPGRPYRWPRLKTPFALSLVVLVVFGGLSLFWSSDPDDGLHRFGRMAGSFLCAAILIERARQLPAHLAPAGLLLLVIGLGTAVIVLVVEIAAGYPLSQLRLAHLAKWPDIWPVYYNSFAALLAVTAPAVTGLVWQRWGMKAASIPALCAVPIFLLQSMAAMLGISLGICFALAVLAFGRRLILAAALILALLAPALPVVLGTSGFYEVIESTRIRLPFSAAHRLVTWRFVSERAEDSPIAGLGMGASRSLAGAGDDARGIPQYRQLLLLAGDVPTYPVPLQSSHPHNLFLQVRLELGWAGIAILSAVLLSGGYSLSRLPLGRFELAGVSASAGAAAVIYMLSYNAWNAWWLSVLILLGVFVTGFRIRNDALAGPTERAEGGI